MWKEKCHVDSSNGTYQNLVGPFLRTDSKNPAQPRKSLVISKQMISVKRNDGGWQTAALGSTHDGSCSWKNSFYYQIYVHTRRNKSLTKFFTFKKTETAVCDRLRRHDLFGCLSDMTLTSLCKCPLFFVVFLVIAKIVVIITKIISPDTQSVITSLSTFY